MGTLIVIEGTDGSGKATQTRLLTEHLQKIKIPVRQLSFPCYDSESSSLIKLYLTGKFGSQPEDVNAFAASTFYAVDRYASFKSDWQAVYQSETVIISDRYTTSNAIYQGEKIPKEQRKQYLEWLYDFEYRKMGIPAPDIVFYLDVPTEITNELRHRRETQNHTKPDIHEINTNYLSQCREWALEIAKHSAWRVINCAKKKTIRSLEDIHDEILEKTLQFLQHQKKETLSC